MKRFITTTSIVLIYYNACFSQIWSTDTTKNARVYTFANSIYGGLPGIGVQADIKIPFLKNKRAISYFEVQPSYLKKDFRIIRTKGGVMTSLFEKGSFKILNDLYFTGDHYRFASNGYNKDEFTRYRAASINNDIVIGFFKRGWYANIRGGVGAYHIERRDDAPDGFDSKYSGTRFNVGLEAGKTIGKRFDVNLKVNNVTGTRLGVGYRFKQ